MSFSKTALMATLAIGAALTLSACQTTASSPNWVEIPAMQNQDTSVYFNQSTVATPKENANWRTTQLLSQPIKPSADDKVGSLVFDITVDCAQKALRFERISSYAKANAQGEVLNTQESKGEFLPSQAANEQALIEAICQK